MLFPVLLQWLQNSPQIVLPLSVSYEVTTAQKKQQSRQKVPWSSLNTGSVLELVMVWMQELMEINPDCTAGTHGKCCGTETGESQVRCPWLVVSRGCPCLTGISLQREFSLSPFQVLGVSSVAVWLFMLASSQLLSEDIYFCNCCIYQGGLAKSVDFSSLAQAVRNYFSNALPWTKCIYFSTSALTSKQWATEGFIYSQTFSGVPIHSSLLYIGFLFGETKGKEKGTSPPNGFWLPVNGGNSTRRYKAQEDVFREVINLLG